MLAGTGLWIFVVKKSVSRTQFPKMETGHLCFPDRNTMTVECRSVIWKISNISLYGISYVCVFSVASDVHIKQMKFWTGIFWSNKFTIRIISGRNSIFVVAFTVSHCSSPSVLRLTIHIIIRKNTLHIKMTGCIPYKAIPIPFAAHSDIRVIKISCLGSSVFITQQ